MKTQRGIEVQLYYFFNIGARWGLGGQRHALAALPWERDLFRLCRRLGGPQGTLAGVSCVKLGFLLK
jgi:hypothetical protein